MNLPGKLRRKDRPPSTPSHPSSSAPRRSVRNRREGHSSSHRTTTPDTSSHGSITSPQNPPVASGSRRVPRNPQRTPGRVAAPLFTQETPTSRVRRFTANRGHIASESPPPVELYTPHQQLPSEEEDNEFPDSIFDRREDYDVSEPQQARKTAQKARRKHGPRPNQEILELDDNDTFVVKRARRPRAKNIPISEVIELSSDDEAPSSPTRPPLGKRKRPTNETPLRPRKRVCLGPIIEVDTSSADESAAGPATPPPFSDVDDIVLINTELQGMGEMALNEPFPSVHNLKTAGSVLDVPDATAFEHDEFVAPIETANPPAGHPWLRVTPDTDAERVALRRVFDEAFALVQAESETTAASSDVPSTTHRLSSGGGTTTPTLAPLRSPDVPFITRSGQPPASAPLVFAPVPCSPMSTSQPDSPAPITTTAPPTISPYPESQRQEIIVDPSARSHSRSGPAQDMRGEPRSNFQLPFIFDDIMERFARVRGGESWEIFQRNRAARAAGADPGRKVQEEAVDTSADGDAAMVEADVDLEAASVSAEAGTERVESHAIPPPRPTEDKPLEPVPNPNPTPREFGLGYTPPLSPTSDSPLARRHLSFLLPSSTISKPAGLEMDDDDEDLNSADLVYPS
ncbi:hypothetical protein B0H11DRAFT_1979422 [Mycena galericulata]|nr:hypothetical protein B0H11DRAFT_1979422 [Mycena galericulata]